MDSYLNGLIEHGLLKGTYDPGKVGGLSPKFFWDRRTFLDCRGNLSIAPKNVTLGFNVRILTQSHDMSRGELGPVIDKRVVIEPHTFIGSFAVLYNCIIRHHAVVACGSVVRNKEVFPYTMVEGNPAKVVKRYIDGEWVREDAITDFDYDDDTPVPTLVERLEALAQYAQRRRQE